MAAYAALVSLMHIIDDIEHHPSPPISLHKHQIQSLTQNVIFLQEFLQAYKSPVSDRDEADPLEMRIADAAYAAEDVIESRIVDKIRLSRSEEDVTESHIADKIQLSRSEEDVIESHIGDKIQLSRSNEDAIESHIVDKIQPSRSKATKIRCFFNCFRGPKDPTNVSSDHDDDEKDPRSVSSNHDDDEKDPRSVSSNHDDDESIKLRQDVQNMIEEMDQIKRVAMETNTEEVVALRDPRCRFVSSSTGKKSSDMMVFSDHDEADPLEMRIADAAYAAEDVIESHIVDNIQLSRSKATDHDDDEQTKLYQDVQKVIEEMDRIKRVAMETNTEKVVVLRDQRPRFLSSSISTGKKSSGRMMFSDDVLLGIMEKLVADEPGREVIPITGMGGIGKTALAQTVYSKQVIKERFDICGWATISEQYNTKEILCELVSQATNKNKKQLSERSEEELGLELYQYLSGRRFLIVMDDMWNVESWNEIQHFFPNNENCSRIMVTTRLSQLSCQLNNHYSHQMDFLDRVSSRVLFSKTVFGEERFPLELKKIGKEIAKNCRGLPLSIVVVGGILKNMEHTQECWESIRNNLTSVVNWENDKHCLRFLKMSYNHLPLYLKPCFLCMGVFKEDESIKVSTLIKLWVREGFLKPIDGKSLETIGKVFLKELVDRNLVLVDRLGFTGNIKRVKVHDLLRDVCVKQGKKEGFYHVIGEFSPRGINRQRRIVIRRNTSNERVLDDLQPMSHTRSIFCEHGKIPRCRNFGLLRTTHAYRFRCDEVAVFGYFNLRHLFAEVDCMSLIWSTINHLWNLQTLIVSCQHESTAPTEIWKMPQLRHILITEGRLLLPDPPSDAVVMENLVVLKGAYILKCDEEVVKRIPNIKKLGIRYSGSRGMGRDDDYCLSNIEYLCKLESLFVSSLYDFRGNASLYKLNFPQTLKSLLLMMKGEFEWEMMMEKIGSLPLLEKFKLSGGCFGRGKWEIFEGQFPCLKYFELFECRGLKRWTAEGCSIFPCLERLYVQNLDELESLPSEIGDIPTLKNLRMYRCSESAVMCAKKIVEEQVEEQGEEPSMLWFGFRVMNTKKCRAWLVPTSKLNA